LMTLAMVTNSVWGAGVTGRNPNYSMTGPIPRYPIR
jgi:hypothetical protein